MMASDNMPSHRAAVIMARPKHDDVMLEELVVVPVLRRPELTVPTLA
jgi:hypothetical protein